MSTQAAERPQQQQQQQPHAITLFRERLLQRRVELDAALDGSGISPDRFIRTAITAATTRPELVTDVSFQSLWIALLEACRDRLLPDGRQGVILAYGRKAKWNAMYRGLIDRFQQSGEFKWITADFHRGDDAAFDAWIDENGQHFLHRPGNRAGQIIETYAAAMTKSGGFFLTIVTEPDMARIRNVSRARSEDSPWQQWPDEMRKKSALRRLCKLLPMPQPLDEMMARDIDDADAVPLAPSEPTPMPRPRGAAQSLEQFADHEADPRERDERPHDEADSDTVVERQTQTVADATTQAETTDAQTEGPKVARVLLETAYERGKAARTEGVQRRAIPPEYRDAARGQEAIAWRKGWDGEALGAVS